MSDDNDDSLIDWSVKELKAYLNAEESTCVDIEQQYQREGFASDTGQAAQMRNFWRGHVDGRRKVLSKLKQLLQPRR